MDLTFDKILDNLNSRTPFTFSRFGDGEWNAIAGKPGANCDGHEYFPEMGIKLKQILESSPEYYIGCQNLARRQRPELIEGMAEQYNLTYNANEILVRGSLDSRMDEFFSALKSRTVALVGPEYLKNITGYRADYIIPIPESNCWLKYENIKDTIKQITHIDGLVILYCASMMSNVLIDDVYHINPSITQIDCGSVFEPYTGRQNRTYHKKIIERNS